MSFYDRMLALAQRVITAKGRDVGLVYVTRSGSPWAGTDVAETVTHKAVQVRGKTWTVNGVPAGEGELVFIMAGGLEHAPDNTTRILDGELPEVVAPPSLGLTSPLDGGYLGTEGLYNFLWTPGELTVDVWELVVGSTLNGVDFHSSGALPGATLSAAVGGLPTDGSTVYARLGRAVGGAITYQYYTFIAGAAPSVEDTAQAKQYKVLDVEVVQPGEVALLYLIRAGR